MFGAVRRDDPQVSLSVNHVSVFFLSGFEKQTRVVCIPRVMLWRQLFALTVHLFAFFFFLRQMILTVTFSLIYETAMILTQIIHKQLQDFFLSSSSWAPFRKSRVHAKLSKKEIM